MNTDSAQPLEGGQNSRDRLSHLLANPIEETAPVIREDYRVRLPSFEGPLDLLLHLIRKEQVDVYDIPISKICKSYLEHIELMQRFDISIAGEFMVMASTLMLLKSQLLLPKEESELEEDDPRLPLVAQLLEYERFKKAATDLDKIQWLGRDVFSRPEAAMSEFVPKQTPEETPVAPIDTFKLLQCYKTSLDRTEVKPIKITTESASLRSSVEKMTPQLVEMEAIPFRNLLPEGSSRKEMVVGFLAILELARLKYIEIYQSQIFGPIQVKAVKPLNELDTGLLDQF